MNLKNHGRVWRWLVVGLLTLIVREVSATTGVRGGGDLTGPWQLLVDDSLVASKENVKRTYHPFAKHPCNPVLVPDKPWEGQSAYIYGTVLPDEGTTGYRLWYHSWASGEYRNLYATSRDGLTWEKPDLGLIDFKGSKANNIFFRRTKEDHLPQVIHTPWEKDPNRRYKLLNYDYGRTKPDHLVSGFWGACSSDGLHWNDAALNPVLKDPGDVGNFVWDARARRYIGYPKVFAPVRGFRRRCVGFTATKNFEYWPSSQLILASDEEDDRWTSAQNQRTEFYGLCAFPYESAYVGFLWIFRITDGNNDGPIYSELVSSRDGINWTRQDAMHGGRVPILPVGRKGDWDEGMVFTSNHPLVEGDTIKLWYGGFNVTHGAPDDAARAGIGLATLRKDGFASLDAGQAVGVITTKPLKHLRGPLRVNANAQGGWLKVEVLSSDGNALPGYSRDACAAIRSDGTGLQVTWGRRKLLPDSYRPLRLRFVFQNAALYSFMGGEGVDLAEPDEPMELQLTFEEAVQTKPKFPAREESILPNNETQPVPYLLLEPTPPPARGRSPLLIYLYGAGGSHQDYNLKEPPFDHFRQLLAAHGYYVLVPELGGSHWMNARAKKLLDEMVEQVLAKHPIDRKRVQIMGTSMGGGSSLAYAIHRPDLIGSVCSHLGMTDFAQWIEGKPGYFDLLTKAYGGSPDQVPEVFRQQSAMANLDSFSNIPVFLISAADDKTVLPHQGKQLADALSAKGYYAVYREAKGVEHENRSIAGFDEELFEFFAATADLTRPYRAHGDVTFTDDPGDAAHGSGAAQFRADTAKPASRLELLHTAQLGPRFTLGAMVKTTNKKPTRLFSNHRGSGEFVTGELLFDFDPTGAALPGLRFVANGQTVLSKPVKIDEGRYHHLAVTYDMGKVALYLDGQEVGRGRLQFGAAHLYYDKTVLRHFDQPDALPEAGIHLAGNLCIGGDPGGRFVTYQDEVMALPQGQLNGFVDDVLVARTALSAAAIRQLSQKGIQQSRTAVEQLKQ